jgi:hypothetical protein
MSDKEREIIMGFEIVPNQAIKPGTLVIVPNKEDISVNDIFIITGLDDKGENTMEPFKPIPKEIDREEYWMSLIMRMVQSARQNKKEEYRELKKEIKRNMLEDKEAREFFQTAFNSVKL